jgi:hypothetical protein
MNLVLAVQTQQKSRVSTSSGERASLRDISAA